MNVRGHPMMIVVAGPAGSGKSTTFPIASFGVDFFNVDDRCAQLNGGSYTGISAEIRARAGAECQAFVEAHIAAHREFAVETTQRTGIAVDQASAARAAGFRSLLFFIATEDVQINIEHVECLDNSPSGHWPRRVLTFENGHILRTFPPLPDWAKAVADTSRT